MSSVQEYWEAIPPLTRLYMGSMLLSSGLASFHLINPMKLIFDAPLIINKFEIWRIFTSFAFFGPFSFPFLMQLMIVGRFGSAMENDPFPTSYPPNFSPTSKSADFMFSLICMSVPLLVGGWVLSLQILGPSLVFGILYLWARRNPTSPVNVWGFRFTGSNLPWVFIAMTVLMGGSPIPDLAGLAAAHLYYFLVEVLPLKIGREVLYTPTIVQRFTEYLSGFGGVGIGGNAPPNNVNNNAAPAGGNAAPRNNFGGGAAAAGNANNANPWANSGGGQGGGSGFTGGHNWGQGRRLGGN